MVDGALRSNKNKAEMLPESVLEQMSLRTLTKTVWGLWCGQKSDWNSHGVWLGSNIWRQTTFGQGKKIYTDGEHLLTAGKLVTKELKKSGQKLGEYIYTVLVMTDYYQVFMAATEQRG